MSIVACAMGTLVLALIVLGLGVLAREPRSREDRLEETDGAAPEKPPVAPPTARPPKPARATAPAEPRDPRWSHARTLLSELRSGSETAAVADAFDAALRTLFGRLDRLAASEKAHEGLGRAGRVDGLRQDVEARLDEVLHALGDVHLHDLSGDAPADFASVDRLLAKVRADAEVNSALATPQPPPERSTEPATRRTARPRIPGRES